MFLDGALEGARAELRVVAFLREELPRGLIHVEGEVLLREAFLHADELHLDDARNLRFVEAVEDDDVIDAVEEFGAEVRLEFDLHLLLHLHGVLGRKFSFVEILLDDRRAEVAGHDDDGVLEIDGAALAVGEASVVEDLQEDVEDVVVGLLDFVEEDDAVGTAAHGFAELPAFLVSDVAGRRADEPRDGVFLHVFAHVDADHRGLVVEEKFREGARQLGLPHAGRPEENEGADGAVGVLESAAGAAHGVRDGGDGLGLADDAVLEAFLHLDEFLALALQHLRDGDAGPCGDDLGNVFLGDFGVEEAFAAGQFV